MKITQATNGLAPTTLLLDEPDEHLLTIQINRPEVANSITTATGRELISIFGAIEADPSLYRCVILTATGDRAFCGGADLRQRDGMTDQDFSAQHYLFERMNRAITFCPVPVICAANGAAVAGGLEILLACDFAYAVETAVFGFTEVSRGIMPGGGGTQQLPRAIGARRAKEVILRGNRFSAKQALDWGVVNKLSAPGAVLSDAIEAAQDICRNAPLSVMQAKKSVDHGLQADLRTGLYLEIEAYYRLIPTQDRLEGIAAYNQKRPPVFTGR